MILKKVLVILFWRMVIKLRLSTTEIFIGKSKVFLKIQHIYRAVTNNKSGPVCSHVFMPVVLDYFLALLVISVNAERTSFSS